MIEKEQPYVQEKEAGRTRSEKGSCCKASLGGMRGESDASG